MAELGVAELRITANPDQALAAIARVRVALERETGDVGGQIFDGIVKTAPAAGAKAGKAVRTALQQTLSEGGGLKLPEIKAPSLEAIKKALDISKDLNATLADLRTYKKLLQDLQATTSATSPEFKRLTATLRETGAAIKAFESGSGNLVEALARVKNTAAGLTPDLSKSLGALNTLGSGLKAATSAALETSKALASISAKGAFEAIKLPVFGLPKTTTDVIEKARAQVERLQKQAETGSGKVARLTEGIFALGGAGAAAKGIVDVLGGVGGTAESASAALAEVAQRLNALPSGLKGLGGLGDLFAAGSESINQFTSGVLNAQGELAGLTGPLQGVTDLLAAIGPEAAAVGGVLAFTFAGFQDLIAKSFKPGVDGARQALKGMTDDTQRLLEALARASDATKGFASLRDLQTAQADAAQRAAAAPVGTDDNLQATQELVELNKRLTEEKRRQFDLERQQAREMQIRLQRETREADAMTPARPPEQRLLPAFQERGLNPLDDSVRAGESLRRITEAIGTNWERGARFLEKSNREMARLIEQGLRLQPLAGSPVAQRTNLLPPGAPSSSLPNPNQYSRPIGPEESAQKVAARRQAQLEDDLADVQAKRLVIQESILQLEKATEAATARAARKAGLLGQSSPISGRLPGDRFIPGSPADLKRRADRRQEAASNALIGGAFPLLFGQGLGASIGGGLGGFAGGLKGGQFGFGASLVGTAVGAQFDAANQKLQALGAALDNPIGKFGELQQAGVLSSKQVENTAASLISVGKEAEAAALIQRDLAATYGDLQAAQRLAQQSDELNRSWTQLTLTLASFAVSPLAQAVADTSDGLQGFAQVVRRLGDVIANIPNLPKLLPAPLQLPQPVQERVNQRLGGSLQNGLLNLLNPLKPIFDVGAGLGSLFGGDRQASTPTATTSTDNSQLEAARKVREQILQLTLRQTAAEAQGNKVLNDSLAFQLTAATERQRLDELRVATTQKLANLAANGKGPGSLEATQAINEADKQREEILAQAATQRQQLAQANAATAAQSERELAAARQLIGLEGDRLTIRKEQQRVDEAQRQFAQADSAFRERFGNTDKSSLSQQDQIEWQALYDRRRALENELTRIRLGAYEEIEAAERRLAQERQKVQSDIAIAQRGNTITDVGRGALQGVDDLKRQIEEVKRLRDVAVSRPGNFDLAKQADDAGQKLVQAGLELRNSLQESARQAELTVRSITRSIEDAKLALAERRNTSGQGINQFLPPGQVAQRQQQLNEQLRAQAQRAVDEYAAKTGIKLSLAFTGTIEQLNQKYIELINSINQDLRPVEDIRTQEQDLARAQADLIAVNQSLVNASTRLAEVISPLTTEISKLTGKDWSVNVNVDQNGGVATGGLRYNPTF